MSNAVESLSWQMGEQHPKCSIDSSPHFICLRLFRSSKSKHCLCKKLKQSNSLTFNDPEGSKTCTQGLSPDQVMPGVWQTVASFGAAFIAMQAYGACLNKHNPKVMG